MHPSYTTVSQPDLAYHVIQGRNTALLSYNELPIQSYESGSTMQQIIYCELQERSERYCLNSCGGSAAAAPRPRSPPTTFDTVSVSGR